VLVYLEAVGEPVVLPFDMDVKKLVVDVEGIFFGIADVEINDDYLGIAMDEEVPAAVAVIQAHIVFFTVIVHICPANLTHLSGVRPEFAAIESKVML
jgi:hypothetical protein